MDVSQYLFSPWQRQAELQQTQAATAMKQMELQAYPQMQQMKMQRSEADVRHLNALAQMQEMTAQKMKSEMGLEQDIAQAVAEARQAPPTGFPEGEAPLSPAMQQASAFRTAGNTLLSKGKVVAAGKAFEEADKFTKAEDARSASALAQKQQALVNYQKETEIANDAFANVDSQESLDLANMQFQQMTGRPSPFAGKAYDPKLIPMYFQNRNMVHGKGATQYQQDLLDFRKDQEARRASDSAEKLRIQEQLLALRQQLTDQKLKAGDGQKETANERRFNSVVQMDVGTGYFRSSEMFRAAKPNEIPVGSALLRDQKKIDGVISASWNYLVNKQMPPNLQYNDALMLGIAFDIASARTGGRGIPSESSIREILRQMPTGADSKETQKSKWRTVFNALGEANENLPEFRQKTPDDPKYFGKQRWNEVEKLIGYGEKGPIEVTPSKTAARIEKQAPTKTEKPVETKDLPQDARPNQPAQSAIIAKLKAKGYTPKTNVEYYVDKNGVIHER